MHPQLTANPNLPVVRTQGGVPVQAEPSLQEWADRVTHASGEAVEKIMAIGRLLVAANNVVNHGEWERMFRGYKGPQKPIDRPVPFSVSTATMFMAIARHQILSNPHTYNDLPPSYRALYELSLLPDETLTMLMAFGEITPDTTVSQAKVWKEFYTSPMRKKDKKRRERQAHWHANTINGLSDSAARIYMFWGYAAAECRGEPVCWPPMLRKPAPGKTCRCECGDVHVDQRPCVGNHE
jgi:hypothetical protein